MASDSEEATAHAVGSTDDVSSDSPLITRIDGGKIAVFELDGEYHALTGVCPHQGGPLGEGKIEDGCVYCPWHGWQFEIESGEHVHGEDRAETFPVSVEDGTLYVTI